MKIRLDFYNLLFELKKQNLKNSKIKIFKTHLRSNFIIKKIFSYNLNHVY